MPLLHSLQSLWPAMPRRQVQRHPALAIALALVSGVIDRAQYLPPIEADQVRQLEELADIDAPVALLQPGNPVLLLLHLLGEHSLPNAGSLPLSLEQVD